MYNRCPFIHRVRGRENNGWRHKQLVVVYNYVKRTRKCQNYIRLIFELGSELFKFRKSFEFKVNMATKI